MNFKTILPHFLAVVIFFLITVIVYHPHFIDGQTISQHDVLQALGANQQLSDFRSETGEEGLWLHTMFSGMPAFLNGVQYSGDLLGYAYKVIRLGMSHPSGITFLSFVSFYVLLLVFGVRQWLAIGGAILFGLNGFNIISITAGHNAKIAAVALMPLVLAGIKLAFTDRRWLGVGLTALALGLQIRANHPQMTYYLLLIVIIYGLYELINAYRSGHLKSFGISMAGLVLAAILAVGANAGKLYHIYDYGKYSIRGASELESTGGEKGLDYEYAFRFSNGIAEPLVMFYPYILGGSSQQELSEKSNTAKALMNEAGYSRLQARETVKAMPTYWGNQPLTAPYYAGSVLLFFVVLGVVSLPRSQKIWLLAVAILGIMLSWGKNFPAFNNFLFDSLPGYNKFRSVTFTIILPILAFNLLAFLGLNSWLKKDTKQRWKELKWSVIVAGGFSVFLLLISGMLSYRGAVDAQLPEWLIGALRDDRKALFRQDIFRAVAFTIMAALVLWGLNLEKLKPQMALLILAGLVSIDGLLLSKRFLTKDNFSDDAKADFFQPTAADNFILAQSKPGERVLNLRNPWNEARTSFYHESIGGYHGAKLRRYQDVVDAYLFDQSNAVISGLQNGNADFSDLQVLNMLNAKFLSYGPERNNVIINQSAFGNAWIVDKITEVKSPQEAIDALEQTNLRNTAVINTNEFPTPQLGGNGEVSLLSKTPNKVVYSASISNASALIVFSEVYYPKGWSATIDGQSAEILRANYILRALEVPAGEHEIVFEFKPASYASTNTMMMICSILIMLGFVGTVAFEIRKPHAIS